MSEKRSITKRKVMQEIPSVTSLKYEVVESVLNAFTDILIRESVMNGVFQWPNAFTIETVERKARTAYNVAKGEYEEFPATKVLNIRLSRKINGFHRWKQRHEYNSKHGLTTEDWNNRIDGKLPKSKTR